MDGSGKTTQMHRLAARLRALGRTVLETAEPGGTPIGTKIRRILLDSANQELCPAAELLLYFASRAQNVDQWIAPALAARRNRALRPLHRFLPGLPRLRARPGRGKRDGARPHRLPRPQAGSHHPGGYRRRNQPGARARPQRRGAALRDAHGRAIHRVPPPRLRGLSRAGEARAGARQSGRRPGAIDDIERAVWAGSVGGARMFENFWGNAARRRKRSSR